MKTAEELKNITNNCDEMDRLEVIMSHMISDAYSGFTGYLYGGALTEPEKKSLEQLGYSVTYEANNWISYSGATFISWVT